MEAEQQIELQMLRGFLRTMLRWWPLILVATIIPPLVTYVVTSGGPVVYEAKAGVAIIRSRIEVNFEPAVKTLTEEQIRGGGANAQQAAAAAASVELAARRQTLVALVQNEAIAERVIAQLGNDLTNQERQPGVLTSMVSGDLAANKGAEREKTDLIQVVVRHANPVKAAKIANAWAETYEQVVNSTYGTPPVASRQVQDEVDQAKKAYDAAQQELTTFLKESQIERATRRISETRQVLDLLQSSRQVALQNAISQTLGTKMQLFNAYVNAESGNRLLGFNKEQERKKAIVSAYIDAQTNAQISVFSKQVEDRLRVLNDAYAAKAKVDRLLRDARALRDQARLGGSAASSTLALALLKSEAFATSQGLPQNMQLRIDTVSGMTPENYARDAEALVAALESQLSEIEVTIRQQSAALVGDEGLSLTPGDLNQELRAAIEKRYPELFDRGELSQLAESFSTGTQLSEASQAIATEILQLQNQFTQDLVNADSGDTPLSRSIGDLDRAIRDLQAQVERDTAKKADLTRARDLAYSTYTTLSRKAAEVGVASQLAGTEVRFAVRAPVPTGAISSRSGSLPALAAIAGFILGMVGSFALDYLPRGIRKAEEFVAQTR